LKGLQPPVGADVDQVQRAVPVEVKDLGVVPNGPKGFTDLKRFEWSRDEGVICPQVDLQPSPGLPIVGLAAMEYNPDPGLRAAGILVWQAIAYKVFESQQEPHDYTAISYAVMDAHDYQMASCEVNVDSIEVFFAADDPNLIVFIDALLTFEATQEVMEGKAFVGYISLRFTGPTRALLGMQRFGRTCAVEVACLKDVAGSQELIEFASTFARNRNIRGIIHWGQRNDCTRAEIEDRFGDSTWVGDRLSPWREALQLITDGGRLNRFSSAFTRRLGLE
jgi:hypothetical protein